MKNKKGFTLVELLAVIVILALIMGIAVVGIGSVLTSSKQQVMFENAQSIISGIKKQLAIKNETPNSHGYGFNASILESGGITSPLGGKFVYGTKGSSDVEITTGLWRLNSTPTSSSCTGKNASYVLVDADGNYTICLSATADGTTSGAAEKYIFGTEAQVASQASAALK